MLKLAGADRYLIFLEAEAGEEEARVLSQNRLHCEKVF